MTRQLNIHLADDQYARVEKQAVKLGKRTGGLAKAWLLEQLALAERGSEPKPDAEPQVQA